MKIADCVKEIEKIAPPKLTQNWDNTGLLIGSANATIKNILLTIDITNDVLAEAKNSGCNFIISYHPVIWDGLKKITADSIVYKLIRSNINVYSMHTALDVVAGGVNDGLAEMVGIKNPSPIGDFVDDSSSDNYKLVVFIPTESLKKLADAMFAAGAGWIGNYSHCGFTSEGQGTFLPLKGARPAIGKKGKLQTVQETRFESIVPAEKVAACLAAIKSAHPYEMPAFDVIKLQNCNDKIGLGRIGFLEKPAKLSEILKKIKSITKADFAGIAGPKNRIVKKAAVCAGSCGKIIDSVISQNCDLYLTGEIKHHQALAAAEANLTVVCLSHSVSERFILKKIAKELQKSLKNVKITTSKKDADPFKWMQI